MAPIRRIGIVAGYLVVCVGLAVAVAGFPSFRGDEAVSAGARVRPLATTTTSLVVGGGSTTTTAIVPPPAPARPPAEVKIRFYNGSRTGGAAVTVGDRLEALGYDVLAPGPSPSAPYDATAIWFVEGWEAEAAEVADTLGLVAGVARVVPAQPPVPGIGDAVVVVVVAEDVVGRP